MRTALLMITLFAAHALAQDGVVTWTDSEGVEHFTNDPANIPEPYRKKAKDAKSAPLQMVTTDGEKEAPPPVEISDPAISMIYFEGHPCPPCEALKKAGTLEKLMETHKGLTLNTVDAEKNLPTMHKYGVRVTPTVVFVDAEGNALATVSGLKKAARYEHAFRLAVEKARAAHSTGSGQAHSTGSGHAP